MNIILRVFQINPIPLLRLEIIILYPFDKRIDLMTINLLQIGTQIQNLRKVDHRYFHNLVIR